MGMRINQNVLSQSTYANLTTANNRLESSIGKLSSGLRINSAADDAAGLAISEKMRRQVRGLSRAKLNAQDGISFIQTAEGALNESQSIMQRMRELALQSANDTLTSNDRLEIQKEVDELKTQIDSIAESTEFNTKKLLNGNQAALVSTSNDAIKGLVMGGINGGGDYDISLAIVQGGVSQMQTSQILKDKNTGNLVKGSTKLEDISSFYAPTGEYSLQFPQTITFHGNGKSAEVVLDGQMSLNDVAASLQNAMSSASGLGMTNSSVQLVPQTTTSSDDGGYLKLTSGFVGDQGEFTVSGSQDVLDALGFSIAREAVNCVVDVNVSDAYGNQRSADTSFNRVSSLLDGIDIKFNSQAANITGNGGIVSGLLISGATTFTISAGGAINSTAAVSVTINIASGNWSMDGLARCINSQLSSNVTGLSASVVDGEIRLTLQPTNDMQGDTTINILSSDAISTSTLGIRNGSYNGFVVGQKDQSKVREGISSYVATVASDTALKVTVGAGTSTKSVQFAKTTTVATTADMTEINKFVSDTNAQFEGEDFKARLDVINGSFVFTSTQVGKDYNLSIDCSSNGDLFNSLYGLKNAKTYGSGVDTVKMHVVDSGPQFQIGADAGDRMKIGIADMGTEALGLDLIDVTSIRASEKSLEKINKALDRVSSERSKLGSYQNRLNYTISNLTNTTTNLTTAESRIRDVDVASEMMEFTRNQIVTQAATSMLAQANALPQNALSLLR